METLPEDLPKEEYFDKDKLQREGKCFHWAQVAHFDEIHIDQKTGMETTTGYQIRFQQDEHGKLIQKKVKMVLTRCWGKF